MPKMRLTDRNVATLKAPKGKQVDYWDAVREGLCLRVSYGGRKTWLIRYTMGGIRKRLRLGTYPNLKLVDARKEARDALGDLFKGNDPAIKRFRAKSQITVKEMARLYIEKHSRKKKRSWRGDEAMLKNDILPVIGGLMPKQVERGHIEKIIERVESRGAEIQANRVFALVRGMFNWGLGKYVKISPVYGMKIPNDERVRDRNLRTDEVATIWRLIEDGAVNEKGKRLSMTEQSRIVLKLLFFLGQRISEVAHAKKTEFDLAEGVWVIPGARTKNKRTHRVPLPPQALGLIKRAIEIPERWNRPCETEYLFPSPLSSLESPLGSKPISSTSPNYALKRVLSCSEIEDVRPHDFRETVATQMAELGIPEVHIGAVLNHVRSNVTATHYIQHKYGPEKRAALEKWERKLEAIIEGRKDFINVVPIREGS